MTERGKIRNKDFARQLRDFSGLQFGTITPTDIDGFFEIGNRIFIFFELKFGGTNVVGGQRLALERLVDVIGKTKDAILIIGRHDCTSDEIVDTAACSVVEYRTRGKWNSPKKPITIREIIDLFLKRARK